MNDVLIDVIRDPLQLTAIACIVMIFVLALSGVNSQGKFLNAVSNAAPTILTSVGIFFTFLGILIALQNFNVEDINAAIPKLLGGLRLAFLSSVMGLGTALLFRFIQPPLLKDSLTGEVTAKDLLVELRALNENTLLVRDSLVGEGDASLSTQIGKLRNDFRDFAEKVAEDGTAALIEALEAVIKDFNEKLSKQFGENFKELNNAVGGLLEWQQEYKAQVQQLTEAFQESQKGIESVRQSIERIEESTNQIPAHMESIDSVFNETQERVKQLYEGLESLSAMRSDAEKAIPFIQVQIEELTSGLRDVIKTQMEFVEQELETMKVAQTETQNLMQKLMEDFVTEQKSIAAEINRRINESLASNTEALNQSFQALDSGMQGQLQRSLDKMGNNLTAITSRFVEIYENNAKQILDLTSQITSLPPRK